MLLAVLIQIVLPIVLIIWLLRAPASSLAGYVIQVAGTLLVLGTR